MSTIVPFYRDPWLVALCLSRTFSTAIFMAYAACLPVLRVEWNMSATAAGSISTAFQFGYATSLLVFSWVADRAGAKRVFLWSAWASVGASLVFAAFARSYWSGLLLYTLVSLSLGGTYTTAVMLIADRYRSERRGAAVGWLIASSSLGYAVSLFAAGLALRLGGYALAFHATALGPLFGLAAATYGLRDTPNAVHSRSSGSGFSTEVMRNPDAVRLIAGYTAHNWEVVGMWTWAPAFLTATFLASGALAGRAVELGAYASGAFHIMGVIASSTMGPLSDRIGRRSVMVALAGISAACSFAFGWLLGWPASVVIAVGALYGFAALGDSPVLSTALTESIAPAYLGTALAIRSFLGFGAGAIAPLVFGVILDAAAPAGPRVAWGWAFTALGVGGTIATVCAWSLRRGRGRVHAAPA